MADPVFRVDLRPAEGGVRVTLAGELDISSAPELRRRQSEIVGSSGDVSIDCGELTFADSSGLDALLRLVTALRRDQRRVVVEHVRPMVRRAMEILQITDFVDVE
jgi:anti-anti-sigma factor